MSHYEYEDDELNSEKELALIGIFLTVGSLLFLAFTGFIVGILKLSQWRG